MTNKEYINYFLMYCESKNLTLNSVDWYRLMLDKFLEYSNQFDIEFDTMTTPEARQYINWLQNQNNRENKPYRDNAINGFIRGVKVFFNFLYEDEYIEKNPFAKVKQIKTDKVIIETFKPEEIKKMLNQFDRSSYYGLRDALLIRLLYDTGLRISEALSIKIDDIDLNRSLIKVFGKGHKERVVPFGRNVKREILKFLIRRRKEIPKQVDEGYLFSTKDGLPLSSRNVLRKIKEIGSKAGIEGKRLSPHTFRHSFAKTYLMAGGDVISLQTIMGHSKLETTRKYVYLLTEDIQKKHRQFSPMDNL
ncbi:MAG TPA: tyrosine-type recombinase/integrase [Syntrophomonadaceae bacterium]|nr:tyrosine-type recombinase/integrase [Syntrophomonadaceae bacterium]